METTDLLVHGAELLATVDDARREVPGGWVAVAGALSDPVTAWLRCGPVAVRHAVVAGRSVVEDGVPVHPAWRNSSPSTAGCPRGSRRPCEVAQ